ncbi:MAG: DUF1874 domain-containing protein [Candidatus Aenigmatarchaeota archaeon]
MATFYILNSFSTNMLKDEANVVFKKIDVEKAKDEILKAQMANLNIVSGIGHESTAKMISTLLDMDVQFNRINVSVEKGDKGIIFTIGFRPEEGKVYSLEELTSFLNKGQIKIYYFEIV